MRAGRGGRAVALAAALGACGDPAWDGDHEGAFVAELACTFGFTAGGGQGSEHQHLEVGFAWLLGDGDRTTPDQQDATDVGRWPTSYLRLHHAPRAEHFEERAGLGRVALGQMFVWDDHDGDRTWDGEEPLVGLAYDAIFIAVPEDVAVDGSGALAASFGPGLHLADPLPCEPGTTLRLTHIGHPGCVLEPRAPGPETFFRYSCP